jgi:hypothetical protein
MMTLNLSAIDATLPFGRGQAGLVLLFAALGLSCAIQIYFAISAVRVDRALSPTILDQDIAARAIESATNGLVQKVATALSSSGEQTEKVRHDLRQLEAAFAHLRTALDARDAEVERLRLGYEAVVAKRMMGRVLRAVQAIDAMHQANPDVTALGDAASLLKDALADAGIEPFEPQPGSDFRASAEMDDAPQLVPTVDPAQDYRLARVIRPGYVMQQADGSTMVLSKAKVAIYKLQEQQA